MTSGGRPLHPAGRDVPPSGAIVIVNVVSTASAGCRQRQPTGCENVEPAVAWVVSKRVEEFQAAGISGAGMFLTGSGRPLKSSPDTGRRGAANRSGDDTMSTTR